MAYDVKDRGELLGVVPKNDRAEVRIYRTHHAGRQVIDIRLWWIPEGQAEHVPSSKGVAFDASKLPLMREALEARS